MRAYLSHRIRRRPSGDRLKAKSKTMSVQYWRRQTEGMSFEHGRVVTMVRDRRRRRLWTAAAWLPLGVRPSPFSELVPPVSQAPLRRCGRCVESTHRRPPIPPSGRPDSTPRRRARNGKAGSHMDAFAPLPSPLPGSSFALPTSPPTFQFTPPICEVLTLSAPSRWALLGQLGPRLTTEVFIHRHLQTHSVRVTSLTGRFRPCPERFDGVASSESPE